MVKVYGELVGATTEAEFIVGNPSNFAEDLEQEAKQRGSDIAIIPYNPRSSIIFWDR